MPPDSSSQNWSDELAAWMKESPHSVPTPSADPTSRLFSAGEKCENPLKRASSNFLRKRCETRILEVRATMRNWNVNDLFHRRTARGGHTSLGTSITCSGTGKSRGVRMSTSCSTICGTTIWSNGTSGTGSTICSTVRRCTCSCGKTSSNGAGRPAAGAFPTSSPASIAKYRAPAAWGRASSGTRPCSTSRAPPLALTVLWPRGRRPPVYTAKMHGGVALAAVWRLLWRGQNQPWRQPLKPFSQKVTQNMEKATI